MITVRKIILGVYFTRKSTVYHCILSGGEFKLKKQQQSLPVSWASFSNWFHDPFSEAAVAFTEPIEGDVQY